MKEREVWIYKFMKFTYRLYQVDFRLQAWRNIQCTSFGVKCPYMIFLFFSKMMDCFYKKWFYKLQTSSVCLMNIVKVSWFLIPYSLNKRSKMSIICSFHPICWLCLGWFYEWQCSLSGFACFLKEFFSFWEIVHDISIRLPHKSISMKKSLHDIFSLWLIMKECL